MTTSVQEAWNVPKMDEDRFEEYLRIESASIPAWHEGATGPREAEILVKKVTSLWRVTCLNATPKALEREKASLLMDSQHSAAPKGVPHDAMRGAESMGQTQGHCTFSGTQGCETLTDLGHPSKQGSMSAFITRRRKQGPLGL